MTYGEPNTTDPTAIHACQQLGRYFAQNGAFVDPITFVEEADSTAGHVYACALPEKSRRNASALSITPAVAQPPTEGDSKARRILVVCEARADTRKTAQTILEDLRRIARPGGKSFIMPPFDSGGDFDMRGVIGPPPPSVFGASATMPVFRVLGIEIVADVQPVIVEASDDAKAIGGQGSATLTLALTLIPASMPAPINAFRAWNSLSSPATVEVRGVNGRARQMIFRVEAGGGVWITQTIDLAGLASLTELYAAIGALGNGWTSEVPMGWLDFSERDPRSLEITPRVTATTASKATVRVLP